MEGATFHVLGQDNGHGSGEGHRGQLAAVYCSGLGCLRLWPGCSPPGPGAGMAFKGLVGHGAGEPCGSAGIGDAGRWRLEEQGVCSRVLHLCLCLGVGSETGLCQHGAACWGVRGASHPETALPRGPSVARPEGAERTCAWLSPLGRSPLRPSCQPLYPGAGPQTQTPSRQGLPRCQPSSPAPLLAGPLTPPTYTPLHTPLYAWLRH